MNLAVLVKIILYFLSPSSSSSSWTSGIEFIIPLVFISPSENLFDSFLTEYGFPLEDLISKDSFLPLHGESFIHNGLISKRFSLFEVSDFSESLTVSFAMRTLSIYKIRV